MRLDSATTERLKNPSPYPELLGDLNAALGPLFKQSTEEGEDSEQ